MIKKSLRMIDDELLIKLISLKCVCRQIVLFHENICTLYFGSNKLLKKCLLGLNRPFS